MFFSNIFKKNKTFVLGCQRSGTTLLRLILNSHRNIHCYGEINGYKYFDNNFKIKHKKKFEAFQLPIWTELFTEYECIKKHKEKNDKILFIFRDPKEVIASMKSLMINDKNYIQYEVCKNIKTWLSDSSRSFKKNFHKEIDENNEMTKAICYWKYKNESFFKMKDLGWEVHLINYKNLVNEPRIEIKKALDFLNINWDENTLFHHKSHHDEVHNNNALGNTKANRKIDKNSLEKWRKILSDQESELINEKTQKILSDLHQNL